MPPKWSERLQAELLAEIQDVRRRADAEPGSLPRSVLDRLKQAEALLAEPTPPLNRLAMLGHGLVAWHLDQGFDDVPVHAAVAALALRLARLDEAPQRPTER
ncbi:MAG: hypothetical protein ABFE08_21135 [Armatimonadia bacterium]